jgi:GH43 family beta-xylosidase
MGRMPYLGWPEYFADPFVLRAPDGGYYAYGTGGPDAAAADTRFDVLTSPDLRRWRRAGRALALPETLRGRACWAPEVAYRDGTYHLYYSAGGVEGEDHRLRVATAAAPAGPFVDAGVEVVPEEPFSIDASPFRDPRSGRWYLFFVKDFFDARVGSGIAVAALADDMRGIAGPGSPSAARPPTGRSSRAIASGTAGAGRCGTRWKDRSSCTAAAATGSSTAAGSGRARTTA